MKMSDAKTLKELGDVIRTKRKDLGYSQEQLAEAVSLSAVYISKIERGKASPSFTVLNRIASVLGIRLLLLSDRHAESIENICGLAKNMSSLNSELIEELTKAGILLSE
jgi:transcriptional regulator with XRE-family HTH domain